MYDSKKTDDLNQENDEHPDLVCTSQLQRWHAKGHGDNIHPQPLMEITVSKTKLDETKIREGVNSLLYGARMNPSHDLQSEVKLDSVSFLAKIMPKKVSYCVPYCSNNFRNNPSLHYYRIPRDRTIRKEYVRLL